MKQVGITAQARGLSNKVASLYLFTITSEYLTPSVKANFVLLSGRSNVSLLVVMKGIVQQSSLKAY